MWQRIVCSLSIVALSGCTYLSKQETAAPVIEIGNYQSVTHGTHVVARGETLYEIAWRYGRDYRDIAMANHIPAPYVIYPGQKISLKKPKHPPSVYAKEEAPKYTVRAAASNEKPTLTKAHAAPSKIKQAPLTQVAKTPFNNSWQWPAKGKIIKSYSATAVGPKGIDISGPLGSNVLSAESGKVVYSGQGLRGYGQLVIIKHNDTYLSAYGHNSELLVKEGQSVSKGQPIAKMGNTDSSQVKLHFEIRKNGQPINPLSILPPKAV